MYNNFPLSLVSIRWKTCTSLTESRFAKYLHTVQCCVIKQHSVLMSLSCNFLLLQAGNEVCPQQLNNCGSQLVGKQWWKLTHRPWQAGRQTWEPPSTWHGCPTECTRPFFQQHLASDQGSHIWSHDWCTHRAEPWKTCIYYYNVCLVAAMPHDKDQHFHTSLLQGIKILVKNHLRWSC